MLAHENEAIENTIAKNIFLNICFLL